MRFLTGSDNGILKLMLMEKDSVAGNWGNQHPSLAIDNLSVYQENDKELALISKACGVVELWDIDNGSVTKSLQLPARQSKVPTKITGLHYYQSGERDGSVFSCNSLGNVYIQPLAEHSTEQLPTETTPSLTMSVGKDVEHSRVSLLDSHKFVTCGNEQQVKLWDITAQKGLWTAKPMRENDVRLMEKTWDKDVTFMPSKSSQLATVTAYSHVRFYDTVAQRKPVFSLPLGKKALSCVVPTNDSNFLLVGDVIGNIYKFDMRTRRLAGSFKGKVSGAVKQISVHPTVPVFVCGSLDRHARVFDINTRELKYTVYLKQRITACAFSAEEEVVENEDDETWNSLKTVGDEPKEEGDEENNENEDDDEDAPQEDDSDDDDDEDHQEDDAEEEEEEEEEEAKPAPKKRKLPPPKAKATKKAKR